MPEGFSQARPDRDYSKPIIEQARREPIKQDHSVRNKLRSLLLAAGITAGAVTAGYGAAKVLNEYDRGAQNETTITELFKRGEIAGIDTSTYEINTYIDGSLLHIRKEADKEAEPIDLAKIRKVNGVPWDESKPFIIKNSPYKMGIDPIDGISQNAWLALKLEVETALGDRVEATGFLNNGQATEKHIKTIDKGKIATPTEDKKGNLSATLPSGRHIPAERIALGIPLPSEPQPQS